MNKKKLEILLEKIEGFNGAKAYLEQYATPAPVAAELLHYANLNGDLNGTVCDLGCGAGILAIGAKILGAEEVYAIDLDVDALNVAKKNAKTYKVEIKFICADVKDLNLKSVDTVLMNPPFGSHKDRIFLDKSFEMANVIYSMHNGVTEEFIRNYVVDRCKDFEVKRIKFSIKRTFPFHKKDVREIGVNLYRFQV